MDIACLRLPKPYFKLALALGAFTRQYEAVLRKLRLRLGFSQKRLAIIIGVHPVTVQTWERGAHNNPLAEGYLRLLLHVYRSDPQGWKRATLGLPPLKRKLPRRRRKLST